MPHVRQKGGAQGAVEAVDARPSHELSSQLAEIVIDAHFLAANMLALAKRKDFAARERTECVAVLLDDWARGVGDLFAGKNFFAAAPEE